MDRNFAPALALALKSEGGWSDNPADPGGATMKGVTLAKYLAKPWLTTAGRFQPNPPSFSGNGAASIRASACLA